MKYMKNYINNKKLFILIIFSLVFSLVTTFYIPKTNTLLINFYKTNLTGLLLSVPNVSTLKQITLSDFKKDGSFYYDKKFLKKNIKCNFKEVKIENKRKVKIIFSNIKIDEIFVKKNCLDFAVSVYLEFLYYNLLSDNSQFGIAAMYMEDYFENKKKFNAFFEKGGVAELFIKNSNQKFQLYFTKNNFDYYKIEHKKNNIIKIFIVFFVFYLSIIFVILNSKLLIKIFKKKIKQIKF